MSMKNSGDIGLVLSGGGAKGAFQVGVWKAMCEFGYADRIKVISGTSVGAINGAAIACLGEHAALMEKYWLENIAEILSPNYAQVIDSMSMLIEGIKSFLDDGPYPFPALVDSARLEEVLLNVIPEKWPTKAAQLYASALRRDSNAYTLERFNCSMSSGYMLRIKQIMASSAFPLLFRPVEIQGKSYIDGGWNAKGGDNIPVKPILDNHPDLKTIIIVRCTPGHMQTVKRDSANDVDFIEIYPKHILQGVFHPYIDEFPLYSGEMMNTLQNLSGVLAFQEKYISEYICQGYEAASHVLWRKMLETDTLKW